MIKSQLLEFFANFFNERGIECNEKELLAFNFVGSGLLDSFEILSMIINLEMTFGIKISPEQISDDKNANVAGLINTLIEQV